MSQRPRCTFASLAWCSPSEWLECSGEGSLRNEILSAEDCLAKCNDCFWWTQDHGCTVKEWLKRNGWENTIGSHRFFPVGMPRYNLGVGKGSAGTPGRILTMHARCCAVCVCA